MTTDSIDSVQFEEFGQRYGWERKYLGSKSHDTKFGMGWWPFGSL